MSNAKISILAKKTALIFDKLSNQLLLPYDLTGSQFKIMMVLSDRRTLNQNSL